MTHYGDLYELRGDRNTIYGNVYVDNGKQNRTVGRAQNEMATSSGDVSAFAFSLSVYIKSRGKLDRLAYLRT